MHNTPMSAPKKLIPEGELEICDFSGKRIRKICHNDEWFFCIIDVVAAMTDTASPSRYWGDLKSKLVRQEGLGQSYGKIEQLKFEAVDHKLYASDAGNTETILRIIQSIPSKKAGVFKEWLARVGYERIQEHQNPAIAIKRAIADYQLQGRSMDWIEARLRTIVSRKELTDEWKERGIREGLEYAILTDEISKGTFGKTTKEHKDLKGLQKPHNLRDNMTSMELILTMLGETATKQIAQSRDAQGFDQNKAASEAGGKIAGGARTQLEKETGNTVISRSNNLKSLPPSEDLLESPPSLEESLKKLAPRQIK